MRHGGAPVVSKPRGWVRIFTVRSTVFILVALMGFILTLPTALQFFKQRSANEALRAQLEQVQQENADATNELSRWEDDRFVIAQARERLTFVFPGEQAYRVVDPESVEEPVPAETQGAVEDGAVTSGLVEDQPWYSTVWDSVGVAGQVG